MAELTETRHPALTVLQRAPGRLSIRAVERTLGLPGGAWQRRRLYALKTQSRAFEEIGIQKGDSLIVEPGKRLRPAQLVVVKEAGRISVRRCESLGGEGSFPLGQVDLLPFMKVRTHVVGTVVGLLRRDERGQLFAAALPAPHPRISQDLSFSPAGQRARQSAERAAQAEEFEHRIRNWDLWTEHHRAELTAVSESLPSCCKDLQKRLATLLECMRQARGSQLFRALHSEALAVCRKMDGVRHYVRRNVARRIRQAQAGSNVSLSRPPTEDCRCPARTTSPECGSPPAVPAVRTGFDTTRTGMF